MTDEQPSLFDVTEEKRTAMVSVRFNLDVALALTELSEKEGITRSDLVRYIIYKYFREEHGIGFYGYKAWND